MDNRWDNLSMSEKNQLLGIYASKGYTDLASIINHYNSFATGGQMNTDGPDDPPDAISGADRVVPNTTLGKTQRNWLQRWYNNRQEQLANNMDASSGSIAGNIGSSFVNPNKYLRRSFEFADNIPILDRRQYNPQELATIAEQTNTYETIKDYQYRQSGEQGFFTHPYGKNPVIGITPLGDETTPLHEYIHAMQHAPYTVYGKQVDAVRDYQKDKGLSSKDYLDKPDEIYSRLMQLRYKNKVNPKHKWTKKEIQDFKKNATDFNILNRYDDDFLLYLFNDVAQNTSSQDTPHYAALGGHLFYDGGTDGSKEDKNYLLDLLRINFKST